MTYAPPEGYRVVETDEVVDDVAVELHVLREFAVGSRDRHNASIIAPSYRWEVVKLDAAFREVLGERGTVGKFVALLARWAVVPKQNRLERIEEE